MEVAVMEALLAKMQASIEAKIQENLGLLAERVGNIESTVSTVSASLSSVTMVVTDMEVSLKRVITEVEALKKKTVDRPVTFADVASKSGQGEREAGISVAAEDI